jgi:hypothetical protein
VHDLCGRAGLVKAPAPTLLPRSLKLPVFDQQMLLLADIISARFVGRLHDLACDRIDQLMPQAVAGLPINLSERHALGCGHRGIQRHRT